MEVRRLLSFFVHPQARLEFHFLKARSVSLISEFIGQIFWPSIAETQILRHRNINLLRTFFDFLFATTLSRDRSHEFIRGPSLHSKFCDDRLNNGKARKNGH